MEMQLDRQAGSSLVEQIVSFVQRQMDLGQLRPGQRLPSIRQLAARHGISYHTAVTAYEQLVASGCIHAQQGRGFFVATQLRYRQSLPTASPASCAAEPKGLWRLFQGAEEVMKLGCGWLPPAWRDTRALARVIRRTANFSQSALVEYGDPFGHLPLRQQLCAHLHRKLSLHVEPQQLLTTLGATQALDLIVRQYIAPGDRVLVDDPCNSNLVKLLKLRGASVVGIPRQTDGPDIEAFKAALVAAPVKAFFINSHLHNPTGSSLSASKAFQLLQLAHQHGVTIVEDDVYGDFGDAQASRLVTLDGLKQVIYIGSFSKTLSASLRVGYIVGAAQLIAPLADLKLLTMVAVPGFCERFVSLLLADGTYQRHLASVQQRLQTHQAMAQECLERWGWELFCKPPGGLFLWIRHARVQDSEAFVRQGEQRGIILLPGSAFSADGRDTSWFRINVAHFDAAKAAALFDQAV